jgi:hypothetical protein
MTMLKTFAVLSALLLLSGCGGWERGVAAVTGWSRVCVDGVSYLQFVSGVTVEYTRDGKIKSCN